MSSQWKQMMWAGIMAGMLSACHKHPVMPDMGSVNLAVNYEVDGAALIPDTMIYTNAAGNLYSVSRLEYYISDVTFIAEDGENHTDKRIQYISAFSGPTNAWSIENIPAKNYTGITFLVGLNSDANKTGYLPPTMENVNMAWPDQMGGGYHFLKLEGHFMDSLNHMSGYALHVGMASCLITVSIEHPFTVKYKNQRMTLAMNINQWFGHPHIFDLDLVNYTMGNKPRMLEVAQNGSHAFTLR
ncbi:MAG: hypothetical protein KDD36_07480 [Flavobacteriales bacterium]|nr:hypothetical protein [Flavobacteriales bacterium]